MNWNGENYKIEQLHPITERSPELEQINWGVLLDEDRYIISFYALPPCDVIDNQSSVARWFKKGTRDRKNLSTP